MGCAQSRTPRCASRASCMPLSAVASTGRRRS
jgi:hypothetical protein